MSNNAQIICPRCGFSREVDPERLPAKSVIATCPKCSCRFRFSVTQGSGEILPEKKIPRAEEPHAADSNENGAGPADSGQQGMEGSTGQNRGKITDFRANGSTSPWQEAPGEYGWFSAFFQTSLRAMFAAPAFFAGLNPHSPKLRALAFYLIVGIFQTVVEKIWIHLLRTMLEPAVVGDPQMEKMLTIMATDSNMALALLLRCGMLAAQIYFLSFLMFMVYRQLRPELATFSLIFQIMAYSAAPSLLCVVPVLGSITGLIWGLVCLAVGLKSALGLSWPKTFLGFVPILLLLAPFFLQLFAAVPQ